MNSKDEELIALIARSALRDELAFKLLYDRVSGYLNGIALRIVKSPDLSNDVLQEAFVQIWRNAASYRPQQAKPLTWLTSIVRYRALDRLDKEKRLSRREQPIDDWLDELIEERGPEKEAKLSENTQYLAQCMENIDGQTKRAITLAYVFGYTREEIADKLQTNTSTVKSWLRRGADKLRKCLTSKLGLVREH